MGGESAPPCGAVHMTLPHHHTQTKKMDKWVKFPEDPAIEPTLIRGGGGDFLRGETLTPDT